MESFYRNVKDFGAVGDGIANDTAAIQRALDAGGAAYLPGGTYRVGTLYLRSNGGLELAPDATLMGSPDRADYNAWDFCPQNKATRCDEEKASGGHLIVALECENVFIGGHGRIWGNREAFFNPDDGPRGEFKGWRPSQMIFFCECRNVSVSDVTLVNSPYWSLFFFGCDEVRVRGLNISNTPWNAWNGDGIAIDCCRNVTVSDCIVLSSDDGVTVRATGEGHLLHHPALSENVTVTNCVMLGHSGMRFGVGTGTIRNCAASNLSIMGGLRGIGVHQSYETGLFPEAAKGCQIEGLVFDNLAIDCQMPFYILATHPPRTIARKSEHQIRHISYNNVRARGTWPVVIIGNYDRNIHDVQMTNCSFVFHGGDAALFAKPPAERDVWGRYFDYGIYMENIRDFLFQNVRVSWEDEVDGWKAALCTKGIEDVTFRDCRFDAPRGGVARFDAID
jgi:polygalacturonase